MYEQVFTRVYKKGKKRLILLFSSLNATLLQQILTDDFMRV